MKGRRRPARGGGAGDTHNPLFQQWEDDAAPESPIAESPTAQPLPQNPELSLEDRVALLPTGPGVYLFHDGEGRVIYCGKAKSLRSRVRSYFRSASDERTFIDFLRRRVAEVSFIVTDTEKEALLLENTLIKKHRPRYNIQLRDDKTYVSLRLDPKHEWPRVHRVRRRRAGDKALYFGPYSSSRAVKETLRFLQRIFPIRSCPDSVLYHRSRPCVLHQIGRCCAPCTGLADRELYDDYVRATVLFLQGKREEVLRILVDKMEAFSEALEFEKAAQIRDRIRSIERTVEPEKVHSHRAFDRDVIALNRSRGKMLVTVLQYRAGRLDGTRHFDFRDLNEDDGAVLESFLSQYYAGNATVPRDILLPRAPTEAEGVAALLAEVRGGPVRLAVPERGEKRRLLAMAQENGREVLERFLAGEKTKASVLEDLRKGLQLPREPQRIECFDISTIQGAYPVGAMTCFIGGEPDKTQYRLFKIRSVVGQDDFSMMREMLTRRFRRAPEDGSPLPDLAVIDGGKGQLGVAVEVLRELGLEGRVPIAGLAKARLLGRSRGVQVSTRSDERVFLPGRKNPVIFDRSNPALFLLVRIRDEAHRFGVSFHRKQRAKGTLRSGLEGIPGVGPTRQRTLLRHFGSVARMKEASLEEIAAVPGVGRAAAEAIHLALHRAEESELPEESED